MLLDRPPRVDDACHEQPPLLQRVNVGSRWPPWPAGALSPPVTAVPIWARCRRADLMRGGGSPRWIPRSAPRAWLGSSRRPGSLASNPSMTTPKGPARRVGAGGSVTTAVRVATGQPLPKGDLPSTAAYSVAPSENRSHAGPTSSPWTCSGAMYAGLPTSSPVEVPQPSSAVAAIPKSVRTTRPPPHSCTLLGLTSRWTMPARWIAASASRGKGRGGSPGPAAGVPGRGGPLPASAPAAPP